MKNLENKTAYITGTSALNITGADWHLLDAVKSDNWAVSGIDYSDTSRLFGNAGLHCCANFFKSIGKNIDDIKCASSARALADMIYHNVFVLKRFPDHIIFKDYMLEEKDINEFMDYFTVLLDSANEREKAMLLRWKDEFVKR